MSDIIDRVKLEAIANEDYGFKARMAQIFHMKSEVDIDPNNLIITTLILESKNESILYAFIYSELFKGVVKPKYYCATPSFGSKDGEYRPKICRFENIDILWNSHSSVMNEVEDYIALKKNRMDWKLKYNHLYTSDVSDNKYERLIEKSNVGNQLFIVLWFNSIYNLFYGMTEIHANEKFNILLGFEGTTLAKDLKFFSGLSSRHTEAVLQQIKHTQDYFYAKPGIGQSFRLGQKIVPLSIADITHIYSMGNKPWREILVSKRLCDLVINRICPGFAISLNSFYINRGTSSIFDNPAQIARVQLSTAASQVVKILRAAKNEIPGLINNVKLIDESLKEWTADRLTSLEELIGDAVSYSDKEIILSDYVLCTFSEFMGKTLYNAIESCMRSETYNSYLGDLIGNDDTFAKFMFEFLYCFLSANYRAGVIHTDVHLNKSDV
jgi:hypothetical protein